MTVNDFKIDINAYYNALSRYFLESSGMYEQTGNNTRSASQVSVCLWNK